MSENGSHDKQNTGNEATPGSELFAGSTELNPEFQALLGGDWQTPVDPYVSYGSVNDEDSLGCLIGLARAMSTTDELLAMAETLGMTPLQLLTILADVQTLFGVITMPVLPPIALIIMDEHTGDTDYGSISDVIATGAGADRSRGMFDELAARRTQRLRAQFDQMATGEPFSDIVRLLGE